MRTKDVSEIKFHDFRSFSTNSTSPTFGEQLEKKMC